jgi:phosphatidylserine/phosphatidylglycerophosphate/cardiolipin synthase-like enzyme
VSGARLFVEPDDGTRPVVQFIGEARRTLDVAMYLLSDRDVVQALEAAPRRGVRVRVMLEEHPYETGPGNGAVASRLKAAGVTVGWSPTTFQLSHDKYAVADGRSALVGTANWTHSAFVGNREYLVVDDDPTDVGQLAALFQADWGRDSPDLTDPRLVVSPTNARADFGALAGAAGQTLDLEAEEMEDPGIEGALVGAARRGVVVRVILPLPTGGPDANAAGRGRLVAGGVQVRRLRNPYVHAKDVVVDGKEAFVGSENLSTSSLDRNREVGLLLADPVAVRSLEATFERDWGASES